MEEKKKLIDLIFETLEKTDYSCEICSKMRYKCRVEIPENPEKGFKPDFSKCDFKRCFYKTLTIEH